MMCHSPLILSYTCVPHFRPLFPTLFKWHCKLLGGRQGACTVQFYPILEQVKDFFFLSSLAMEHRAMQFDQSVFLDVCLCFAIMINKAES